MMFASQGLACVGALAVLRRGWRIRFAHPPDAMQLRPRTSAALDYLPHDGADLLSGLQHLDAEGDDLIAVLEPRSDERDDLVEGRHRNGPALQYAVIVDAINRWASAAVEDRGERHLGDHGVLRVRQHDVSRHAERNRVVGILDCEASRIGASGRVRLW